jgi:hypothetical protein
MNVKMSLRRVAWVPALLLATACERGPSPEQQARIEELTVANREREQLLQEMAETSRFLSEISSELAKVQVPKKALRVSSESPLRASRDTMMQKIRYVTRRVGETEARLKESRQRVEQLTGLSDSLRQSLEETVSNFDEIVTAHRATIEFLSGQVQGLEAENQALNDTLTRVAARANTVYYVIGTEDELLRKGLLVKEGGSRFLFVLWKQGVTLQPSRDLTPDAFTKIDRRRVTEIPLPDRTAEYRIASRQDLDHLETTPTDEGAVRGAASLRIADSDGFWAPSRYLIIIRKGGRNAAAAS